ncbi:unnamed protein product [marine sediment metagenome]|uniref:Uncharacterized protein n=1 Tax=marine sediment metagenome TaxID=412755 RepID=X0ZW89_9ZZZZ
MRYDLQIVTYMLQSFKERDDIISHEAENGLVVYITYIKTLAMLGISLPSFRYTNRTDIHTEDKSSLVLNE